ncbi:prefoldin subunit alpha [Candidatus Woesearchaeota archaeon]|nr:prefoldin subunit alpha [Candidatus Woesearchaeota archaeon]
MSEEIQQKLVQFQILQKHIEKIGEHVEMLNAQNEELEESLQALRELQQSVAGSAMLAPVANGIFVKGTLTDTTTLLVNVGSDTVVEKTISQVLEMLSEQQKEITSKVTQAQELLAHLHERAQEIYQNVEEDMNEEAE